MDVDNNRSKSSKGRIWLAQINVNATAWFWDNLKHHLDLFRI
jgi:hypothetical protein